MKGKRRGIEERDDGRLQALFDETADVAGDAALARLEAAAAEHPPGRRRLALGWFVGLAAVGAVALAVVLWPSAGRGPGEAARPVAVAVPNAGVRTERSTSAAPSRETGNIQEDDEADWAVAAWVDDSPLAALDMLGGAGGEPGDYDEVMP